MKNTNQRDPLAFEDPLSNYEPHQYASDIERSLAEGNVGSIQIKPFVQIEPHVSIRKAIEKMQALGVSCLVVTTNGRLEGIFTERDVLERVAEQYPRLADMPVSTVMTGNPTVVYESDPAAAALSAIAIAGHRHVPVLGIDEQVIGVISPRRIFDFLENLG